MTEQGAPTGFAVELAGFGPRLGRVVIQLQVSQSEFARRVGVSAGFVSEMVRGNKRPGAEFLLAVRKVFGVSTDWLLAGEGSMFGGSGIDLALLRTIRLLIAIARAAVAENDPTARALLLLIRDGRLDEAVADKALKDFLDGLNLEGGDVDLATELYNGHLGTDDPAARQRNLLAAAVAHFEARKPLDRLAALAKSPGLTLQVNMGANQRNAGRDYHEH